MAFVVFGLYASLRHIFLSGTSVAFEWATGAAVSTAVTFLSSVVYHVTSPNPRLAMITRQLDFAAIYISISIGSVADLAAVTRGFVNVPIVSIIDVPVASLILLLFFAFRRYELTCDDTFVEEYSGCTFGVGLLRRWHTDGAHTSVRFVTSFCLSSFYFTVTPAVLKNSSNAVLVLGLNAGAFILIGFGMILDNILLWPDDVWHKSSKGVSCTSFPRLGCALTSHGLWHILAFVGAVMIALGREYTVLYV